MDPTEKVLIEATGKAAVEVAGQAYGDILHPAAAEIGEVLGRIIHAVTIPIRGPLWCLETAETKMREGLEERVLKIPEEKRKMPDPEIAVPAIQSLQYTIHNETLREMYLNLLANSMNINHEKNVHPSFVELIRKMNTLDAKVFEKLVSFDEKNFAIIRPYIHVGTTGKIYANKVPDWFIGWTIEGYDYFDVSASIVRLHKLGLIELHQTGNVNNDNYHKLTNDAFFTSVIDAIWEEEVEHRPIFKTGNGMLEINEYGFQFIMAVLNINPYS